MRIAARVMLLTCGVVPFPAAGQEPEEKGRFNVLFIAVDDLRPLLGCYGDRTIRSPNIDRIAARGIVFDRAYCQQAVCSPSRSSLMTGRRPDTTKVWDLETHFRKALPDVVTLAQHFKNHGYHTQAFGKIYHPGFDDPPSWSVPTRGPRKPGNGPEGLELLKKLREEARKAGLDLSKRENQPRGLPWEAPDLPDGELADGSLADQAIEALGRIKDKPFFLAVGFLKPHLPFVAPKKYWDLYSRDQFRIPDHYAPPEGAPKYALSNWGELRAYHGIPKTGPLTPDQAISMIHGYHAATSYMDAQLGRVLDELERLGLRDRTVILLWGDHGWHLGDLGMWCKHTNYEVAVRSPLICSVPGKAAGRHSRALVEFVDIYPSLAEICGLPVPEGLEGTSFAPLLDDPDRPWKRAAFSQYPRSVPGVGRVMGYSVRTDRFRFTEWKAPGKEFRGIELYDHLEDPNETRNLAVRAEMSERVKEFSDLLNAGWRSVRP